LLFLFPGLIGPFYSYQKLFSFKRVRLVAIKFFDKPIYYHGQLNSNPQVLPDPYGERTRLSISNFVIRKNIDYRKFGGFKNPTAYFAGIEPISTENCCKIGSMIPVFA